MQTWDSRACGCTCDRKTVSKCESFGLEVDEKCRCKSAEVGAHTGQKPQGKYKHMAIDNMPTAMRFAILTMKMMDCYEVYDDDACMMMIMKTIMIIMAISTTTTTLMISEHYLYIGTNKLWTINYPFVHIKTLLMLLICT